MAELSSGDINNLPDSDFAYIEPGGSKDAEGKTTPRSLRHFPIHDAAHVRNALARASQSPFGDKAMPKIKAAAKKLGIDVSGDEEQQEAGRTQRLPFEQGGVFVRSLLPGPNVVENDGGMPKLFGTLAVFDEWAEIKTSSEGHFLERIERGAFTRTLKNNPNVPVLYQHGQDPQIGPKPIGTPDSIEESHRAVDYQVSLFDVDYVRSLLPALGAGKAAGMGSSFTFKPIADKMEVDRYPKRSAYNPERLPEVVHHEVRMLEFGPGIMPFYAGTTAGLRSGTDEFVLARFVQDPTRLRDLLQALAVDAIVAPETLSTERPESATHSQREDPSHRSTKTATIAKVIEVAPRFRTDEEWLTWLSRYAS